MIEFFSKPTFSPAFVDYGSFILCRPGKSYKVNANVCILKANKPVLYDVGMDWHMISLIKQALRSINKSPRDLKFAIISHFHPDHSLNLLSFRRFFPNCSIIIHNKTHEFLVNFKAGNKERKSSSRNKIINRFNRILEFLQGHYLIQKNTIYVCEDGDILPIEDLKLKVIFTPGHFSGHICLHDFQNKFLFLGDHIPHTPWLDISENSIDNMMNSIRRLLELSSEEVQYSVRGHGNLSDNSREVYPWEEEKKRFSQHLKLIESTIEKIPIILKKNPLTIEALAYRILKNKDFMDYSSLMNRFFMPPNLTWIISYLLKLKKENQVKQIGSKWISF
ncbi:MAG: MBL fold metallo-hydrolase [Promethearchaeota archaeon]